MMMWQKHTSALFEEEENLKDNDLKDNNTL